MLDYYKRKLEINDFVNMDYQRPPADTGWIVGFTAKKVKVHNLWHDRIFYIKPSNLTLILKSKKK